MMNNEDFQRPDPMAMIDQRLDEARAAINQLEYTIREGFKELDMKIKKLSEKVNDRSSSRTEPEPGP